MKRLVFVLLLKRLVHLVSIVHNVLFLLQVFFNFSLIFSLLLQLLKFALQLVSFLKGCLFLLISMKHLFLHFLELLDQSLLVLFVQLLFFFFLFDIFEDFVLLFLKHGFVLVNLSLFLLEFLFNDFLFIPKIFLQTLNILFFNYFLIHSTRLTAQTLSHLFSEPLDFLLELTQQGILGIFVDSDIILDVFGSVCVLES